MLTTSERRGLSLLVLVLALGAARDLWTWHRLGRPDAGALLPSPSAGAGWSALPGTPAPIAPPAGVPAPDSVASGAGVLDLNRATSEELDRLPGIGPVLAGRILEHRARYGPFRQADDLLAVPGIGPRLLERLGPRVRAGAPRPPSPAPGQGPPAGRPGR